MKINIQIKSIYGNVLFEFEKENNTIKDTVEEAVRQRVSLGWVELSEANLQDADLSGADLRHAYLRKANLRWTNLIGANLYAANLYEANLIGANLYVANLYEANLIGASLSGANLYGANLIEAKNAQHISLNCPSEGSFIGWKKIAGMLVKLEIPEDAKRSSATTNKCRCNKAKVLTITDLDGNNHIDKIWNTAQEHKVLYQVGKMVYPDSFDEDRWHECSHGIHFFIDKQDAINY